MSCWCIHPTCTSMMAPWAAITGCWDCKPCCKRHSHCRPISCCWPATHSTTTAYRKPCCNAQGTCCADARVPVVLLPGNHDSILPECLFRRAGLDDLEHVHVLGVTHSDAIMFAEHDLEIRGRALHGYSDMQPLDAPSPRTARWHIVMAHGHYVPPHEWDAQSHRAWRISDERWRRPVLTTWRSAIGIAQRRSAMARYRPTIPVHQISQAPSMSFD